MPLIGSDRSPAQPWTNHHGYWGQLLSSPTHKLPAGSPGAAGAAEGYEENGGGAAKTVHD